MLHTGRELAVEVPPQTSAAERPRTTDVHCCRHATSFPELADIGRSGIVRSVCTRSPNVTDVLPLFNRQVSPLFLLIRRYNEMRGYDDGATLSILRNTANRDLLVSE